MKDRVTSKLTLKLGLPKGNSPVVCSRPKAIIKRCGDRMSYFTTMVNNSLARENLGGSNPSQRRKAIHRKVGKRTYNKSKPKSKALIRTFPSLAILKKGGVG